MGDVESPQPATHRPPASIASKPPPQAAAWARTRAGKDLSSISAKASVGSRRRW